MMLVSPTSLNQQKDDAGAVKSSFTGYSHKCHKLRVCRMGYNHHSNELTAVVAHIRNIEERIRVVEAESTALTQLGRRVPMLLMWKTHALSEKPCAVQLP